MGVGIVVPSLPSLGVLYGVGIFAMSVAISGFAAARLFANLALTSLLRRTRLRSVLVVGLVFHGISTIVAGFAGDYVTFIVFRSLSGLGSAAYTASAMALMIAIAPPLLRGRAMGLQSTMLGIGTVAGPAVGGSVVVLNPQLPLIVYGAALLAGSLVALILLRDLRSVRTEEPVQVQHGDDTPPYSLPRAVRDCLRDPLFRTVVICQIVLGAVYYGVRSAIIPAHLEALGLSTAFVGGALTVAAFSQVLSAVLAGLIGDRVGRFPLLIVSGIAGVVSFVLFGLPGVAFVMGAAVALGIAGGLQHSAVGALLADSPSGRSAVAVGIYWVTFDLSLIVGPTVGGLVAEFFGAAWVLAGCVVVIALALLNTIIVSRNLRNPPG